MSLPDSCMTALEALRKSYDEDRLAHAYLIEGSPQEDGLVLAESLLTLLFCRETNRPCGICSPCRRVKNHSHPDVVWIEPRSKSRQIAIEQTRELNQWAALTSYEGGWKAGVILYADRLGDNAANAFLKTLEEPPARCLFLLITPDPQFVLPTILSRCQRVILKERSAPAVQPWRARVLQILGEPGADHVLDAVVRSEKLKAVQDEVLREITEEEEKRGAEEEDEKLVEARIQARLKKTRTEMMEVIQNWRRDILLCSLHASEDLLHHRDQAQVLVQQAAALTPAQALNHLRRAETVIRRLERNLPVSPVWDVDQIAYLQEP